MKIPSRLNTDIPDQVKPDTIGNGGTKTATLTQSTPTRLPNSNFALVMHVGEAGAWRMYAIPENQPRQAPFLATIIRSPERALFNRAGCLIFPETLGRMSLRSFSTDTITAHKYRTPRLYLGTLNLCARYCTINVKFSSKILPANEN